MIDQTLEDDIRFSTFIEDQFQCKCYWKGNFQDNLKDNFQQAIDDLSLKDDFFIDSAFNQYQSPIPNKFGLYVKGSTVNESELWESILNKVN